VTATPTWPTDLVAYRRTPDFDEATLPAGLRRAHSTKPGVWAKLHVEAGSLRFTDETTGIETELGPGVHAVIRPESPHHVTPIGPVRFFVEFYVLDGKA
jgi:tellurite resistance-related uncharacterized protein